MTRCEETASQYQVADGLAQALASAGKMQRVECGDRLFSFGDAAQGVYLIVNGTARASLPGGAGHELVCQTAGPGSVLGLPSALCATRYQFDVVAVESVDAIFVEATAVNEILRGQPELCMRVMNMMCDELSALRQTSEHMRNCMQQSCSLHGACMQAENLQ
jgi:CRP-like cAMP-binding protein